MPTRAGGQSLSTGKSMELDTHGREAARPAPTPIREDQTPLERCCASSSNTRSPRSRREGRQEAPHWAPLDVVGSILAEPNVWLHHRVVTGRRREPVRKVAP